MSPSLAVADSATPAGSTSCNQIVFISYSFLSPVNKVGHLLQLADEYQAKGVHDLCVKCLTNEPKSVETAVKILFLANRTVMAREDRRLDGVRGQCYDLIKNMELADIQEKTDYKNLDQESLKKASLKEMNDWKRLLGKLFLKFWGWWSVVYGPVWSRINPVCISLLVLSISQA